MIMDNSNHFHRYIFDYGKEVSMIPSTSTCILKNVLLDISCSLLHEAQSSNMRQLLQGPFILLEQIGFISVRIFSRKMELWWWWWWW